MLYLSKTFHYGGNNIPFIEKNFPWLLHQTLLIQYPLYNYNEGTADVARGGLSVLREGAASAASAARSAIAPTPRRVKAGDREDLFTQNLGEKNYRFVFNTESLTGGNANAFFQYYLLLLQLLQRRSKTRVGLENFTIRATIRSDRALLEDFQLIPLFDLGRNSGGTANLLEAAATGNAEDIIEKKMVLANAETLTAIAGNNFRKQSLLYLYACVCMKIGENGEVRLHKLSLDEIKEFTANLGVSGTEIEWLIGIGHEDLNRLVDFPIHFPELKPVKVNGTLKFTGEADISADDIYFYDLFIQYKEIDAQSGSVLNKQVKYNWSDSEPGFFSGRNASFDFAAAGVLIDRTLTDLVSFVVKGFDGAVLTSRTFPIPGNLEVVAELEVPVYQPIVLDGDDEPAGGAGSTPPLKGKVFNPAGKCKTKNLTVALQVKFTDEDEDWTIIAVATTEDCGNFIMDYPKGIFAEARALVLESPDAVTDLKIIEDDEHVAKNETIVNEFIFLLIPGEAYAEPEPVDEDCECGDKSALTPRLPDQVDLINSGKYSQDLGAGGCVNLTTPNRTLSERDYFAIVRTSDPDVANYVIEKTDHTDADGFQKVLFTLTKGNLINRKEVTLENPIQWFDFTDNNKDDDIIYQAVTVATGHILRYKSVLKADGYSLGDLLYSMPLAPGQKKQIAVYDFQHQLEGSETQRLVQREGLNASILSDRAIISSLDGSINESLSGSSRANTGGVSAGLGIGAILGPVGAVLGVSGGYSSSGSSASQSASRTTAQDFNEVLRTAVMQSASAFRELNATVIHSVTEGQQFTTTTEVISNHNHCHSLTMLYFEVLRHFAVFQELVQVEECLFVPLIMTHFTQEKIRKWRDVIAGNLMSRPSNTYFSLFRAKNPLLAAFDANERVLTNWQNVDYPTGRYCDEQILDVKGNMSLRVNIPRPKTRYDRIFSLPIITKDVSHEEFDAMTFYKSTVTSIMTAGLSTLFGGPGATKTVTEKVMVKAQIFDEFITMDANFQTVPPAQSIRITSFLPKSLVIWGGSINFSGADFFDNGIIDRQQWERYATILNYSNVYEMLDYYFAGKLVSEWDRIFYNDLAPAIYRIMSESIKISGFNLDLTTIGRYTGGEKVMSLNLQGSVSSTRSALPLNLQLYSSSANAIALKDYVTFTLETLRVTYQTAHFSGVLYSGRPSNDILDGASLYIPLTAEEKRNPRKEDKFIVNELITHLNSNLEYYNKVLMYSLSADKRQLLLDGFQIQVYDGSGQPSVNRSLASVVKNQLIGIVGNTMVFPVAPGVRVDRSYIVVNEEGNAEMTDILFNHYRPLTPAPPFRISVPTRGIYSEALMGACDSCETLKDNSSQDWEKFKTDEPTSIGQVTVPTPQVTDWKAAFKDFATPIVNIQNAPAMPEPGAGLKGLNELLGKSDIFRDVTGLTENQKNAMATYLSNQENAKAFASMAKEMAMQAHNTANSERIKKAIDEGEKSGKLSKDEAGSLTKDHIKQMVDGGAAAKAEREKETAPASTLTDAATQAIKDGKDVKATTVLPSGQTETVEVKGKEEEGFKEGEGLISQNARNFRSGTELDKYLKNEQPKDKNNYRPQTGNMAVGNIEPFKVGFKNPRYCNIMYIAGDNNLSSLVYEDLLEMQNATKDGIFSSLVLFDLVDNTGMYVIEINNNRISLLERWTVNLDNDLEALTVFLARAIATYDTAAFRLIGFWGHGTTTFMRKDPELELRDLPILPDDNTGARKHKSILLNQLRNGLAQATLFNQSTRKFDVIYFDACLLQTAEMASEMSVYADYMVASQELVPGTGQNYDAAINAILTTSPSSGEAIGKVLVEAYKNNYAGDAGADKKQTFSLLDLSKLNKLQDSVKNLATDLLAAADPDFKLLAEDLYTAVQKTLQFPFFDYPAKKTEPVQCTIDLVSLLNNFKEELAANGRLSPTLQSLIDITVNAATSTVLANFADSDVDAHISPDPVASGISVWFPKRDVFVNELKADLSIKRKRTQLETLNLLSETNDPAKTFYPQIIFVKNAKWMELLNRYILAEYF